MRAVTQTTATATTTFRDLDKDFHPWVFGLVEEGWNEYTKKMFEMTIQAW